MTECLIQANAPGAPLSLHRGVRLPADTRGTTARHGTPRDATDTLPSCIGIRRQADVRTPNTALAAAMCAGLAAVLAGCGGDPDAGTNGVGKLPAATIESKARSAAGSAASVHLTGELVSKGRTYQLDVRLKSNGGSGQVSTKGSTFELLRVGKDLYLKAAADFWAQDEGNDGGKNDADSSAAARELDDKYVKVPVGDPSYERLSGMTDKSVLLDGILALHGTVSTGDRARVGGVRTISVRGDSGRGGRLDVSLQGTPYPLRMQRAGGAGVIRFEDWNQPFTLAAPAKDHVVDYGAQIPSGT
jgi:hypothetical protein